MKSLLIANRGEIALRILRTARAMALRTIAVYSNADRDAPHAREADHAVRIGGARPRESHLDIEAIVAAARASGADAVHPGYGFLAENADFAQAVLDAGLTFVGPPPAAIRAMGHKSGAKALMRAAKVPCVPGSDDPADAESVGFPLMIKAAAGGGGRGMRLVARAEDFADALRAARSEALHAFGSDEVLLERAIVEPRHVEVQVFADTHGNVVHLGERDCSVQRRHQKLIEESPSPAVDAALRARMGAVAVASARAIGYVGAGTIEFLLDADRAFYFMEMNTRLQVEHAVTEAVAGIDLVEWQIRVARGEPLPLDQQAIDERLARGGHAIEVRLCAEDPSRGFLPQSGRVVRWRVPAGVRCDHALGDGVVVPPFYDSMLAKLVAHAPTRDEARLRLAAAADECELLGLRSNRAFLADCLRDEVFARGEATTAFVEHRFPPERRAVARDETFAAALLVRSARRYPAELERWSNGVLEPRVVRMELDGEPVEAIAGTVDLSRVRFARDGDRVHFDVDAGPHHSAVDISHRAKPAAGDSEKGGRVVAPINGRVVAADGASIERVEKGQLLAVIEAMKMEHRVVSPVAGRVVSFGVRVGQQVAPGDLIAEIGDRAPK